MSSFSKHAKVAIGKAHTSTSQDRTQKSHVLEPYVKQAITQQQKCHLAVSLETM